MRNATKTLCKQQHDLSLATRAILLTLQDHSPEEYKQTVERLGDRLPDELLKDHPGTGRQLLIAAVEVRQWRRIKQALAQALADLEPRLPGAHRRWQHTCYALADVLAELAPALDSSDLLSNCDLEPKSSLKADQAGQD